MFNPKDPLFNMEKAKELLRNKDVILVFIPSAKLRELIAKGEHPIASALGPNIKNIYLEGDGVVIQKRLVWEYIHGKLDSRHTWIFQNGEIKIADDWSRFEDKVVARRK